MIVGGKEGVMVSRFAVTLERKQSNQGGRRERKNIMVVMVRRERQVLLLSGGVACGWKLLWLESARSAVSDVDLYWYAVGGC